MSRKAVARVLNWLLTKSTEPVVIYADRGRGKSNVLALLAWFLSRAGWIVVIIDPKNAFPYIHLPNAVEPEIASEIREKMGIDPQGFPREKVLYFMPRYYWEFEDLWVPKYYLPVPVSMKMVNKHVFYMIGETTMPRRGVILIYQAYQRVGRSRGTVEQMRKWLLSRIEESLDPRILDFLDSGILDDASPLEPDKIASLEPGTIVVLSSMGVDEEGILSFWYGAFLNALRRYMKRARKPVKIAVLIDETLELTNALQQTESSWWLTRDLFRFMTQGRQLGITGLARSRMFLNAQIPTAVPYQLTKLAGIALLSPDVLTARQQLEYMRNHFSTRVEDADTLRIDTDAPPGAFTIFAKRKGFLAYLQFWRPPFLMVQEWDDENKARRYRRFIENHVKFVDLTPLYEEAVQRQVDALEAMEISVAPEARVTLTRRVVLNLPLAVVLTVYAVYQLIQTGEKQAGDQVLRKEIRDVLASLFTDPKDRRKYLAYTAPAELKPRAKMLRDLGLRREPTASDPWAFVITPTFPRKAEALIQALDEIGGIYKYIETRQEVGRRLRGLKVAQQA